MARMQSPTDRTQTVSSKLSGDRLERFETFCDTNDIPKTEAIRRAIDAITTSSNNFDGRHPPTDDDLAKAWHGLKRLTNGGGGWVREDRAKAYLAQRVPDYSKQTVYGGLLRPLQQRGYIRLSNDVTGQYAAVYVYE